MLMKMNIPSAYAVWHPCTVIYWSWWAEQVANQTEEEESNTSLQILFWARAWLVSTVNVELPHITILLLYVACKSLDVWWPWPRISITRKVRSMGVGAPHTECPQKCLATTNFVSVLSDEIEPVNRQILIFQSALLPLDSTLTGSSKNPIRWTPSSTSFLSVTSQNFSLKLCQTFKYGTGMYYILGGKRWEFQNYSRQAGVMQQFFSKKKSGNLVLLKLAKWQYLH